MKTLTTLTIAALVSAALLAQGQQVQNPTNKTGVIGLMHAIHSVNDVDKTLAFYQSVFGLNGRVGDFDPKGPRILNNAPTLTLKYAMTNIPAAFNFELTQFNDLERVTGKQPDIQDSGAPMMKLLVRDLDAIVANAKKANAPFITKGGVPVTAPTPIGTAKAIIMRDPDGYFVEAIQATPAIIAAADAQPPARGRGQQANAAPPAPAPIVGAVMGATVRDMDETLKYWNGVLAMEMPQPTAFVSDQAMLDLMGLPKGASYRMSSGTISGSTARLEFIEIKGVPRKAFDLPRTTDAMACGMALRVGHIRDLLAKIKAAGGRVMSKDQALVEWSDTVRNVFVKDPNGLNLELVGSADPNL